MIRWETTWSRRTTESTVARNTRTTESTFSGNGGTAENAIGPSQKNNKIRNVNRK